MDSHTDKADDRTHMYFTCRFEFTTADPNMIEFALTASKLLILFLVTLEMSCHGNADLYDNFSDPFYNWT